MRRSSLIAAALVLSLSACDRVSSSYPALADARKDRLFERGWLPDILPASSRDIRVASDLDLNRSEGEFFFDPSDFAAFVARLRATGDSSFEYSAGGHTWIFTCERERGHCRYAMR
jgi:hypothetical protein